MANNRHIGRAIATLVMLMTVLPIFATAFACGNHTYYTLTITATSGGTTSPEPGTYSYPQGTNVTVTAVPDDGYELSSWLLDGSCAGSSNNITITMNSKHCIQAVFSVIVPEFPTAVPLVIFFVAALFLALLYKKTDRSKKPTPRP